MTEQIEEEAGKPDGSPPAGEAVHDADDANRMGEDASDAAGAGYGNHATGYTDDEDAEPRTG